MAGKKFSVICLLMVGAVLALPAVSASDASLSDLKSVITSFDDPLMDTDDLAFYLATHNFDAKPNGQCVDVDLDGKVCKLKPNGSAPGLCSIEL